jgi:hypothetical protein
MNYPKERHQGWLSNEQELLLKASLLEEEEATAAWQQWKSSVDIEDIDLGSYRLLPLLYRRLSAWGVSDPLMEKIKGVYRLTWYKNQITINQILPVLQTFHSAGIETLILKGAALISYFYKNYGVRFMNDFDLLVRPANLPTAIAILQQLNWKCPPEKLKITNISISHAILFKHESGMQLDLHWHLLPECLEKNADEDFWQEALSSEIGNVPTLVLNPTDGLFHVCIHGAKWSQVPPIRWVADAIAIINSSPTAIDWDRLLVQAQKRQMVLRLKATLTILRDLLDVAIPESILKNLAASHATTIERLEYRFTTGNLLPLIGRFMFLYCKYLRIEKAAIASLSNRQTALIYNPSSQLEGGAVEIFPLLGDTQVLGFFKYIQYLWQLEHLWQVPWEITSKGMRRIWLDIFSAKTSAHLTKKQSLPSQPKSTCDSLSL